MYQILFYMFLAEFLNAHYRLYLVVCRLLAVFLISPTSPMEGGGGEGALYKKGREGCGRRHLCAWGNDAASEVIPRRVNCWLKTISKPPLWPSRVTENLCKGSLSSERARAYELNNQNFKFLLKMRICLVLLIMQLIILICPC